MLKEIYIIKNYVNSKVYIGLSVNTKQRWSAHLSNAKLSIRWSAIDLAIKKLGAENFYYEIIETTHLYDEREAYWIKYYNSLLPNGYNYCLGGGAASGIGSANAKIRNNDELEAIINDLSYTNKSLVDIAVEYKVDKRIISAINRGTSYKLPGLNYPLRKKIKDMTVSVAKKIQKDLLSNLYLLKELTLKYNCSLNVIEKINRGDLFKDNEFIYPLFRDNGKSRKLTRELELELKYKLLSTNIPIKALAEEYNLSSNYVRFINIGKSRYEELLSYPLRKQN